MSTLNKQYHYRQLILERSKKPRHKGQTNPIHCRKKVQNPYCGDTIELTLALNKANQIADIKFQGSGCALCLASADLMAEAVKNQTTEVALLMVEQFRQMLQGQTQFEFPLDKLNAMQGVSQYPVRIKCVTLPWHTLKAALHTNYQN